MRRWNGEYVIILFVSGIFSETNGFQKSDLRVSDHTRSSRPYSNQLIPWLRQLSGSIQKWFLLPSVSISALSVPSNTGVLSSVRYLISRKTEKLNGDNASFLGTVKKYCSFFLLHRIWSSYSKSSAIYAEETSLNNNQSLVVLIIKVSSIEIIRISCSLTRFRSHNLSRLVLWSIL